MLQGIQRCLQRRGPWLTVHPHQSMGRSKKIASLQQHLVGPSQINSLPAEVRQALIREISNLRLDIEKHELIVDAAERLNTLAKAELRRTADGVERLSKELDEEAAQLRQQALAHRLASLA